LAEPPAHRSAKNGFGGYVGDQPYGCNASITTSGDIKAHAYSLEDILNPTAMKGNR